MRKEKTYYLTKEGYEEAKEEYEQLKKLKLAKTKEGSPEVWHSEDINPDYIAYKEDIDFLDKRISELEEILKNLEIIETPPKNERNKIKLGATVKVKTNGEEDEFKIVGTLEADPTLGKISNESPVGRTLLGHKKGDKVIVKSATKTTYKIKEIKYNLS